MFLKQNISYLLFWIIFHHDPVAATSFYIHFERYFRDELDLYDLNPG